MAFFGESDDHTAKDDHAIKIIPLRRARNWVGAATILKGAATILNINRAQSLEMLTGIRENVDAIT